MKNQGLFTLLGSICLVLILVATPFIAACAKPAPTPPPKHEPIVLEWVSFTVPASVSVKAIKSAFFDRVNEKAKGELIMEYRGGPEVIGAFDQGPAVQQGVVDITFCVGGFYEALVPGINALLLSNITAEEERSRGAYDYLNELHMKAGLHYLGRGSPSTENFFRLMLNEKIEKPEDFKGLKIGTATAARAAIPAWGAAAISVGMPEYYSAMERGLVVGIASATVQDWLVMGIHEVTKYGLDHPYFKSSVSVTMNLDKFNSLPKHLQKLITETYIEAEKEMEVLDDNHLTEGKKKLMDLGMEFYKWPPDAAKWLLDTAYSSTWDYQQERFPEVTPKLRELFSKK